VGGRSSPDRSKVAAGIDDQPAALTEIDEVRAVAQAKDALFDGLTSVARALGNGRRAVPLVDGMLEWRLAGLPVAS
jgi:hypothetical protein